MSASKTVEQSFVNLVREIEENLRLTERSKAALRPALSVGQQIGEAPPRRSSPAVDSELATSALPRDKELAVLTPRTSRAASQYSSCSGSCKQGSTVLEAPPRPQLGNLSSPVSSSAQSLGQLLYTPGIREPLGRQLDFGGAGAAATPLGVSAAQRTGGTSSLLVTPPRGQQSYQSASVSPRKQQIQQGARSGASPVKQSALKGQFGSPIRSGHSPEKENQPASSRSRQTLSSVEYSAAKSSPSGAAHSRTSLHHLAALLMQEAASAHRAVEDCFQAAELQLQELSGCRQEQGGRSVATRLDMCARLTDHRDLNASARFGLKRRSSMAELLLCCRPGAAAGEPQQGLLTRLQEHGSEIKALEGVLRETSTCLATSLRRAEELERENAALRQRLQWHRVVSPSRPCELQEAEHSTDAAKNCTDIDLASHATESRSPGGVWASSFEPARQAQVSPEAVGCPGEFVDCSWGREGEQVGKGTEADGNSEGAGGSERRPKAAAEERPLPFAADKTAPCSRDGGRAVSGTHQPSLSGVGKPIGETVTQRREAAPILRARDTRDAGAWSERSGVKAGRLIDSATPSGRSTPVSAGSKEGSPASLSSALRDLRRRSRSSWDTPSPSGLSEKAASALREALIVIRRSEEPLAAADWRGRDILVPSSVD